MIIYSAIILKYLAFSPNYTPGVTWRLCAIVNFNSVDLLTRQRNRGDVSSSPEQQQLAVQQDSYMQSRAEAIQNLESTTNELSQIFRQLATMVSQQGEIMIDCLALHDRIDENMDDSLVNVEGAQEQLLKHLDNISSNRWLMSKIFIVLIIFLLIFVLFIT
ncbi:syntaxin-32 [Panicum miliaceum]|uniref:Syntaxin-32 n=1 Tax=Panicum miliaceum TaxID=4540 RepID=A0A3L6R7S1_PANMI|nr:syntaxin-32 [Panicum miliaceum]